MGRMISWKTLKKRTCCDNSLIRQDGFHDYYSIRDPLFFPLNRKMLLTDVLFTMINLKGITLSLESSHPGMELSKPSYLKQHMKINPLAIFELYHLYNKTFYEEQIDRACETIGGSQPFLVV